MANLNFFRGALSRRRGLVGLLLIGLGEALILIRVRPFSDIYFPFTWIGYILFLDAATQEQLGHSLFNDRRRVWLAMFPVSVAFWWLFELLNVAVHNWVYIGANNYAGPTFAIIASLDFSTVLPGVWTTAFFVYGFIPRHATYRQEQAVPPWALIAMLLGGILCLVLPVLLPKFAFGLIWGCMFLLLDPVNHWHGRPSVVSAVWNRRFRVPLTLAFAALVCGFFWEAWNYWSLPKWRYDIPYVGFWHIFEMPLLGWLGYLPFGLELFAMTNFVLPLLRLGTLTLIDGGPSDTSDRGEQRAS